MGLIGNRGQSFLSMVQPSPDVADLFELLGASPSRNGRYAWDEQPSAGPPPRQFGSSEAMGLTPIVPQMSGAERAPLPSDLSEVAPQQLPQLPQRRGLFGGMQNWLQEPVGNGSLDRADVASLIGATLKDVGASIGGRDARSVSDWTSRLGSRQAADAVGQALGGVGAGGKPVDPRSTLLDLQLKLLQAGSRGADVAPYLAMLPQLRQQMNESAYLSGVPEVDRNLAGLDPTGYAKTDLANRQPKTEVLPYGSTLATIQDGKVTGTFAGQARADPATTDRVTAAALEKYSRGEQLSTPEQALVTRFLQGTDKADNRPTPNSEVGAILNKVRTGQQLTPGEQQIFSRYVTGAVDPVDQLVADAMRGTGMTPPTAPPPTAPAAQAGGLPPQARAKLRAGQNTTFGNGQVWTLRNGQPVRVK